MAERYDGFISYSHAADDLLAPRLQAGLQRFAKPWWKRQALRVFRDESSLSANPHLWSSITDALDNSEWFVLLLSEDAASSEWVNREVEYWLANKPADRILPVVTDGDFGWADGEVSGTASPPALAGVFDDEPRWVDLRWARTDEHLDLNNARFRDGIADIASAVRQVPKDELESEEVRQHRRTIRTAWAAGGVVLLLGIAATVGAIVAVGQSNEAQDQRDEAQRQAGIADANAEEAKRQAEIAEENEQAAKDAQADAEEQRTLADRQRIEARANESRALDAEAIASARELEARASAIAAAGLAATELDPELGVLLGLEALSLGAQERSGIHAAIQANRTLYTISWSAERRGNLETIAGKFSPDGGHVLIGSGTQVEVREAVAGGDVLWTRDLDQGFSAEIPPKVAGFFSLDGSRILVPWLPPVVATPDTSYGAYVLDSATGATVDFLEMDPCTFWVFPPDGNLWDPNGPLVIEQLAFNEESGQCSFFPNGTVGLRWPNGEYVPFAESWIGNDGLPTLTDDYSLFALPMNFEDGHVSVFDVSSGELVADIDGFGVSTLSKDGSEIIVLEKDFLAGFSLRSVETGELLQRFQGTPSRAWFSPDGERIVTADYDGSVRLYDWATGAEVLQLRGHRIRPLDVQLDTSGELLLSHSDTVRVWNVSAAERGELPMPELGRVEGLFHPSADATVGGGVWVFPMRSTSGPSVASDSVKVIVDGVVAPDPQAVMAAVSPDGTMLIEQPIIEAQANLPSGADGVEIGSIRAVDPRSGEVIVDFGTCGFFSSDRGVVEAASDCEPARNPRLSRVAFGPDGQVAASTRGHQLFVWGGDGSLLYTDGPAPADYTGFRSPLAWSNDGRWIARLVPAPPESNQFFAIEVLDTTTWDVEAVLPQPDGWTQLVFTADDSRLLIADTLSNLVVVDTSTWETVSVLFRGQGGSLADVAASPNSRFAATAGVDGFIRIWDLDTGGFVEEFRVGTAFAARNVEFLDEQTLLVTTDSSDPLGFTLDSEVLARAALERVTRGFDAVECATYAIDPCPRTIEEVIAVYGTGP